MVISFHLRDPQICLVMSCQLAPNGSLFLRLSFLSFQFSFFLFSSSLHSKFFLQHRASIPLFFLSFFPTPTKQTFQFKQYPQTFQFKQSLKSLTHHSIFLSLSVSDFSSMVSADVKFRCFVEGLSWAIDDQALERAFSLYNDILESKVR